MSWFGFTYRKKQQPRTVWANFLLEFQTQENSFGISVLKVTVAHEVPKTCFLIATEIKHKGFSILASPDIRNASALQSCPYKGSQWGSGQQGQKESLLSPLSNLFSRWAPRGTLSSHKVRYSGYSSVLHCELNMNEVLVVIPSTAEGNKMINKQISTFLEVSLH